MSAASWPSLAATELRGCDPGVTTICRDGIEANVRIPLGVDEPPRRFAARLEHDRHFPAAGAQRLGGAQATLGVEEIDRVLLAGAQARQLELAADALAAAFRRSRASKANAE